MGNSSDRSPESRASTDDAWLHTMLREHTTDYINDGDFSQRVLGALPAVAAANRRRQVLIMGAGAIGLLIAILLGGRDLLAQFWRLMDRAIQWSNVSVFHASLSLGVICTVVFCGGIAFAAWRAVQR